MKSELDLRNIWVKAINRQQWQGIVKMVTDAAYSNVVLWFYLIYCLGEKAIIYKYDSHGRPETTDYKSFQQNVFKSLVYEVWMETIILNHLVTAV